MPDDTIHFARWNGQGRLLELGVRRQDPALPFDAARLIVANNVGLFSGGGQGAGQFSDWVEVAQSDGSRTRSNVLHEVPDAVRGLVAQLGRGNATSAPEPGRTHVWTSPVRFAGPRDLEIDAACDAPVARAVIRSLASGAVAVPVEGDGGRFVRGENAQRYVFVAELAGRLAQFGIVRGLDDRPCRAGRSGQWSGLEIDETKGGCPSAGRQEKSHESMKKPLTRNSPRQTPSGTGQLAEPHALSRRQPGIPVRAPLPVRTALPDFPRLSSDVGP